ncbi:hypothetical protein G4B88_028293 [Cannabis sativa]|uniref:Uncharacterized protein n=1 Tax=Cannabis sativa TaxID=3483 RepID=A0A7J6E9Z9_CANSA|nr:hypothetical protein G4B88_028293 [Cannabis sativa]
MGLTSSSSDSYWVFELFFCFCLNLSLFYQLNISVTTNYCRNSSLNDSSKVSFVGDTELKVFYGRIGLPKTLK